MFDAAERVLRRDGVSGLTSRAVTDEAGVAKGVMHRHFIDFDGFVAELILDRVARLNVVANAAAGTEAVVDNLTEALTAVFTPLAVATACTSDCGRPERRASHSSQRRLQRLRRIWMRSRHSAALPRTPTFRRCRTCSLVLSICSSLTERAARLTPTPCTRWSRP